MYLEGGALAGAGAVSCADKKTLPLAAPHPLDGHVKCVRGLGGVRLGAD